MYFSNMNSRDVIDKPEWGMLLADRRGVRDYEAELGGEAGKAKFWT